VENPGTTDHYANDAAGNRTDVVLNGILDPHHDGEAANQVLGQVYDVAGNVISDTAPFAVANFLRGVIVGGMILCYEVAVSDVSVGGDAIVGGRDRPATERASTAQAAVSPTRVLPSSRGSGTALAWPQTRTWIPPLARRSKPRGRNPPLAWPSTKMTQKCSQEGG
jgi:hypothetical protein